MISQRDFVTLTLGQALRRVRGTARAKLGRIFRLS
jgi:hypothetical protein